MADSGNAARAEAQRRKLDSPDVRKTLVPLFATPISNLKLDDAEALNAGLISEIHAAAADDEGLSRSNVGGWHSATDFLLGPGAAISELRERITARVKALCRTVARNPDDPAAADFDLEGWANVLSHGQYHSMHSHPNAAWSGVYYVTGNPGVDADHPFSGKLELFDPRPGASLSYVEHTNLYGRFLVNPVAGQLVLFPGWLQHMVHPYFGPGERITVAVNATLR